MAWQQQWPLQIWSSWDPRIWLCATIRFDEHLHWRFPYTLICIICINILSWGIGWHAGSRTCPAMRRHRIESTTWNRRRRNTPGDPILYPIWTSEEVKFSAGRCPSHSEIKLSFISKKKKLNCRAGHPKQESEQLLSLEKMLPHLTSRFRSMLCILTDRYLTGILLWEVITFCVSICSVLYGGMHGRCCHRIFRMGAHCAGLPAAQMWKLRAKSIRFRGRKDARSRKHRDKFF